MKYHNIIGTTPQGLVGGLGDGRQRRRGLAAAAPRWTTPSSELIVPADHTTVHCHPLAVMEVRRILLEHLAELRGVPPAMTVAGPPPNGWPPRSAAGESRRHPKPAWPHGLETVSVSGSPGRPLTPIGLRSAGLRELGAWRPAFAWACAATAVAGAASSGGRGGE